MFHQPVTSYQVSLIPDEVDFLANFEVTWLDNKKEIQKSGLSDFRYFGLVSETVGIFLIVWKMVEEIDFENRHFWNFKSHMTLTLISDDLESHIVVNVSLTLTNTTIWFVAALSLIVDVRMDGRTYVRIDGRAFLPGLLGHLWGDDLTTDRKWCIMYDLSTHFFPKTLGSSWQDFIWHSSSHGPSLIAQFLVVYRCTLRCDVDPKPTFGGL